MENYKIKVNNEAESKEVQELFKEVNGCIDSNDRFGIVCLVDGRIYTDMVEFFESYDDCKELTLPQLRDLVASHRKPTEQGLISGKEALIALANGEVVEVRHKQTGIGWSSAMTLNMFNFRSSLLEFRIKPRTIKLSLEIPAPFEPKEGETYWFITDSECGYNWVENKQGCRVGIAAWRTEEQIKQVVAALRGAIKNG